MEYGYEKDDFEAAPRKRLAFAVTRQATVATTYDDEEMNHLTQANTVSPATNRSWVYNPNGNRTPQTIVEGGVITVTDYEYNEVSRLIRKTVVGQGTTDGGTTTAISRRSVSGPIMCMTAPTRLFAGWGLAGTTPAGTRPKGFPKEGVSLSCTTLWIQGPSVQKEGGYPDKRFITSPAAALLATEIRAPCITVSSTVPAR